MKTILIILALVISASSFASHEREIEIGTCLNFPNFIPVDDLVEGIHYTNESYTSNCDGNGYDCDYNHYQVLNYKFKSITTTEHYTREGKLLRTTKSSVARTLSSVVHDGFEETYKKIRKEISKTIYDSNDDVCGDSFFKN